MRTLHRGPAAALLGLALIVMLGGCTGDGEAGAKSSPTDPAAVAGAVGQVGAASPGAPAPALPVLASRDSTTTGDLPVRVSVNDLRVQGRLTTLTFTVTNLAPASADPQVWEIGADFSDQVSQGGSLTGDDRSIDGVYLLDSGNAKRYLAARDAAGDCMCSHYAGLLNPGRSMVLTSVFAALPAEVTSADLVVPLFGSFDAVPVSR